MVLLHDVLVHLTYFPHLHHYNPNGGGVKERSKMICSRGCRGFGKHPYWIYMLPGPNIRFSPLSPQLENLKVNNLLALIQGVKRGILWGFGAPLPFYLGCCTILTLFFYFLFFNSYGQRLWGGM